MARARALVAPRPLLLVFVTLAVALLVVGQTRPQLAASARRLLTDLVAPVMGVLARPAEAVAAVEAEVTELLTLRRENRRLTAEVEALRAWHAAALRLDVENKDLRALLAVPPEFATDISARVVSDPSRVFAQSVLIGAGSLDGVREGQAALSGEGLVGRVVDVGQRSARVLLLTDLNARIPVRLESSARRAILSGDNGPRPRLIHMAKETPDAVMHPPIVGERVITSGDDGVFPAGLPVGLVVSVDGAVEPFARLDRLVWVRLTALAQPVLAPVTAILPD